MDGIIRTLAESDHPLCPNGISRPIAEAHILRTRLLDAFDAAAEKDAEGDMVEAADKAYYAAAYGPGTTERMHLYVKTASFMHAGRYVTVESFYWRCGICGLILPAQRTESIGP